MIKKILFLFCLTVFTFCVSFFNEIKEIYVIYKLKERVVFLDFFGGLGNQMFEYSYAYAYAKKHNKILHYTDANLLDDLFSMPLLNENYHLGVSSKMTEMEALYFEKEDAREIKDIFENKNIFYLSGYFQDASFFESERNNLLKIFTFKYPLSDKNQFIADEIKSKISVSVHFRLGDYFDHLPKDILSNHYYLTAMQEMKNKFPDAHFYIFSDDTNFVKQNVKIPFEHTFVEHNNSKETSFWDMYLMSLCQHNIIANSTFSWWGAWLNQNPDKIVITPSVWISEKEHLKVIKNVIPQDWKKIAPKAEIAVILPVKENIRNFDYYFIPFDKKSYFVVDNNDSLLSLIQEDHLRNYDYVFVLTKPMALARKVYWDVVPFDTDDSICFNQDVNFGKFVKMETKESCDLIAVKGVHLHKILDFYR